MSRHLPVRLRFLPVLFVVLSLSLVFLPAGVSAQRSSPPTNGYYYVVQPGDTLADIAWRTGVSVAALRRANPTAIHAHDWLWTGDRLWIPGNAPQPRPTTYPGKSTGYWYTVKLGDTWYIVSRDTGVSILNLWHANPALVRSNQWLYVGDRVWIPGAKPPQPLAPAKPYATAVPMVPEAQPPSTLVTVTPVPAATSTATATSAPTSTSSPSPAATTALRAVNTATSAPTETPTTAPTDTPTAAPTATATTAPTDTPTTAPTATATATETAAPTQTATEPPTVTATAVITATAAGPEAAGTPVITGTVTITATSQPLTATATVTATPAVTATQALTATPAVTGTVAARPADCPADLTGYPAAIASFLNRSDSTPDTLSVWLKACGALTDKLGAVAPAALQNKDNQADLIVVVHEPSTTAATPKGMLLVYFHSVGGYVLAAEAEGAGEVALLRQDDVNQDGKPDIVWTDTSCGAHTCFSTLFVDSWDGTAFRSWIEGQPTMAYAEYGFKPAGQGGQGLDITAHGGTIGSVGAGPQRAWTETYSSAEGGPYRLVGQVYDKSDLLYFAILDANKKFDNWVTQGFGPAIDAYQAAIDDNSLKSSDTITNEVTVLRDFARFRLMLSLTGSGKPARASTIQPAITTPAIAGAAKTFMDSYNASHSIVQACRDTTDYALAHPESWNYLADWGYANPTFAAEDLCPLGK